MLLLLLSELLLLDLLLLDLLLLDRLELLLLLERLDEELLLLPLSELPEIASAMDPKMPGSGAAWQWAMAATMKRARTG